MLDCTGLNYTGSEKYLGKVIEKYNESYQSLKSAIQSKKSAVEQLAKLGDCVENLGNIIAGFANKKNGYNDESWFRGNIQNIQNEFSSLDRAYKNDIKNKIDEALEELPGDKYKKVDTVNRSIKKSINDLRDALEKLKDTVKPIQTPGLVINDKNFIEDKKNDDDKNDDPVIPEGKNIFSCCPCIIS